MMSLTLAQEDKRNNMYRCLKFMYTLPPSYVRELADQFLKYFKPHRNKVVHLYYDRSGNNYKKVKQDLASQLKKAIEVDGDGKRTGWRVILMSEGQGNIGINEEYNFMMELFGGHNKKLPRPAIDRYHCKQLKSSIEGARTQKNTRGQIVKDKRSEKLPVSRLPMESTNPSDSFKYLMMRKTWRYLVSVGRAQDAGDVKERG
jgi:hypothetical protein